MLNQDSTSAISLSNQAISLSNQDSISAIINCHLLFAEKQRFASLYNNNQDSISAINQLSFADAQSRFHIGNKSKQSSNKSKQSRLHIGNNQLSFADAYGFRPNCIASSCTALKGCSSLMPRRYC